MGEERRREGDGIGDGIGDEHCGRAAGVHAFRACCAKSNVDKRSSGKHGNVSRYIDVTCNVARNGYSVLGGLA